MRASGRTLEKKLLLGRLLTRSGDQAWDFAVPLALLQIFPDQLRWAALYYLLVKIGQTVLLPRFARFIDRTDRLTAIRAGIFLQTVGVILGAASLLIFWQSSYETLDLWAPVFGVLVFGGFLSSIGSAFSEIAIANDLVPASIAPENLVSFNGRLRRVDLFTEVTSPIAAGFLLMVALPGIPHAGFMWIVIWNIVSFVPEYYLLASVLRERPDLNAKVVTGGGPMTHTFTEKLFRGWKTFFRLPVWPAVACYAILWLSVLSPHGVLLTAFLKDGWHLPEWMIGTFRGAGAFFGLAATVLFPLAAKRFGLIAASRTFLVFQALCVCGALFCFYQAGSLGQMGFLGLVLLSRVGLYGFSLGEVQLRQISIPANLRGEMNGFANVLTGVATLAIFGAGALLPDTADFHWLILGSVLSVTVAAIGFLFWAATAPSVRGAVAHSEMQSRSTVVTDRA